jgi:hypothetical protein
MDKLQENHINGVSFVFFKPGACSGSLSRIEERVALRVVAYEVGKDDDAYDNASRCHITNNNLNAMSGVR